MVSFETTRVAFAGWVNVDERIIKEFLLKALYRRKTFTFIVFLINLHVYRVTSKIVK